MNDSFVLKPNFFQRSTLEVARNLLGKFLIRRQGNKENAVMITEVEAYDGHFDLASHARFGRTKRNEVMFGPPGYWYVYFVYGMHWMLNIVTGPENFPAAILIRGSREIQGPARLTKFLHINADFNGKLASIKNGLWLEDRGIVINKSQIHERPRIGVKYAGPQWAEKPYRFQICRQKGSGRESGICSKFCLK